jgi:hypothetical protein
MPARAWDHWLSQAVRPPITEPASADIPEM